MGTSSILDGNRFDTGRLDALDPSSRALVERRMNTLGTSYRLFYRRPVQIVRGLGTRLYDAEGREYLDAYNNVASVGHCNPAVVAAVTEQLNTLATHSRYLQDGIVEYSERLLQTFPEPLNRVMYTNSGSEANDLALRVARHHTGGTGIVVTSEAYHGTTASCAEVSPSDGGGGLPGHVIAVDPPNPYRHEGDTSVVDAFAARVTRAFETLRERGHQPAALLVDTIFSSDGVFPVDGALQAAFAAARAAGALVIADEVQPGFARVGTPFWGFARDNAVPDLVTLGKPMGNGVPVAGMVANTEILEAFGRDVPYFNTFGGSSVPVAAAAAVLDEIEQRRLFENAETVGAVVRAGMEELAGRFPEIGDIRSAGLYFGVELVADPQTREPATAFAADLINACRDGGLLISVCGPTSSTLKIRPMLTYTREDAELLVERLGDALEVVRRQAKAGVA
ncbi:aspartate aminotransferase family protein [Gordonia paraffinivorans]|uniref:aspartate aminotransferase family protein n=1 Tax=Gordonia paraffinivorans TaxID=175628 RepID=UPI00144743AA|nr:aspartate aminotransferase family protein [Gordonia paraffinivorans]